MKSKKFLLVTCILKGSILVSACDGDGDNRSFNASGTSQPFANVDEPLLTGIPTGIEGTWVQDCLADNPDDAVTEYSTATIVFASDTANVTNNAYTDSSCTVDADPSTYAVDYSLEFPNETTTTSLGAAAHINLTAESTAINGQPVSPAIAEAIGLNSTIFDLLLTDNNTLYFGDTNSDLDGNSEVLRPDTLDTRLVFTRQ